MFRRFSFVFFIVLASVCSALSISAAEVYSGKCETDGPWQYDISRNGTARIVGYTDLDFEGVLEIPEKVNGIAVTTVYGLGYMEHITKAIIPDSVTTIARLAFNCDTSLEEVTLPSSLVTIERSAFRNTQLTSVEIPGSVATIGDYAFSHTPLETVSFVSGGPIRTSENPFAYTNIQQFSVPGDHPNLASYQGVLFDKTKKELISFPSAAIMSEYTIPEGIKSIGKSAFAGSCLQHVSIPDTVTGIETYAFTRSELAEIILPDSVEIIGESAFSSCKNLKSIHLGSGLKTIKGSAFADCSLLPAAEIPENVQKIEPYAFDSCSALTEFTVSDQNPSFLTQNQCLIEKDSATIVSFPGGLNLKKLEIPDGILTIGEAAFSNTLIQEIILPDSIRVLEENAFAFMPNLSSIQLNNGLMSIGFGCFQNSDHLTELTIPRSVGRIDSTAFPGTSGFSVRVEKGSFAESFCRSIHVPTYFSHNVKTDKITLSSPVLGFSEMKGDDLRNRINEYLQGISAGQDLPAAGQETGFPGTLNVQELTKFGEDLLINGSSAVCPACMEGTWLISLKYDRNEVIGEYLLSSTETRCFAGSADQVIRMDGKENLTHVCFARNGILYDFSPAADGMIRFCVSVSASSEEILGLDNSWDVETFRESYISWTYDAEYRYEEGYTYSVTCVTTQDEETSAPGTTTVLRYTLDGQYLPDISDVTSD